MIRKNDQKRQCIISLYQARVVLPKRSPAEEGLLLVLSGEGV